MCCGFVAKARATRKMRATRWSLIFLGNRQIAPTRISRQSPVTLHYHRDGRGDFLGVVRGSSAGRLTLRFAAEVVFRTLPKTGILKNIAEM
jgi:hypothetical protein